MVIFHCYVSSPEGRYGSYEWPRCHKGREGRVLEIRQLNLHGAKLRAPADVWSIRAAVGRWLPEGSRHKGRENRRNSPKVGQSVHMNVEFPLRNICLMSNINIHIHTYVYIWIAFKFKSTQKQIHQLEI